MVLAIVEGAVEDYENVKFIMDRINLNLGKLNYVLLNIAKIEIPISIGRKVK